MKKIGTSVVSGAALLALSGTASAGPMSAASGQTVKPQTQVEQIAYRYHHRHYGGYRGRHYGYGHRYYHHRYYGWNPGAAAVGAAAGLAGAAATGYSYPNYGYGYSYPNYGYGYNYPYYPYRR